MLAMQRSLRQAVLDAGGNSIVAGRLGVSEQRLSNWIERGVPVPECAALEAAVEQRWMRWDERPNDWHRIWPELKAVEGSPAVAANDQEVRSAA
jgi:DNA-binding transcriptional regulator YdaS (Cro superfamily)